MLVEPSDDKPTFRKTKDLFAIRQCLKEIPAANKIVFNTGLKEILRRVAGDDYFVVKSIYFDKPPESNWFVAYSIGSNHFSEI